MYFFQCTFKIIHDPLFIAFVFVSFSNISCLHDIIISTALHTSFISNVTSVEVNSIFAYHYLRRFSLEKAIIQWVTRNIPNILHFFLVSYPTYSENVIEIR